MSNLNAYNTYAYYIISSEIVLRLIKMMDKLQWPVWYNIVLIALHSLAIVPSIEIGSKSYLTVHTTVYELLYWPRQGYFSDTML